ncbi:cytochrome P450 [Mycena leptocephala]|nr:cytochrome P450 [Mycena leptocephala]
MEYAMHYATALAAIVLAVYSVFRRRSAIRDIPGPPSPSWIFGHMRQLLLSPQYGAHEFQWLNEYGSVYSVKGCFGQDRLMVADPVALQYVLNSPKFCRAPITDNIVFLLFGEKSVFTARGNEHRRLRSALNVGFTAAAVRSYQPVFRKVAEMISAQFADFPTTPTDICSVISPATLSAISEAILGHSTQDLGKEFVENNVEIVALTATQSEGHILADAIGSRLPGWLWRAAIYLPTASAAIARREKSLARLVGGRIVQEKVDAAKQGLEINNDLFSLLRTYLSQESYWNFDQRQSFAVAADPSDTTKNLSPDDLVAQVALFYLLAKKQRHPEFQEELRAETSSHGNPTNEALENMPLLNAFVKEILRLYPAVPLRDCLAQEDMVIPLGEHIRTSKGERINQILLRKGELVTMGIGSHQRLDSRWGKNPHEFNPSRWLDGETYQEDAIGPYANLFVAPSVHVEDSWVDEPHSLSFFGGPRTCLGWRFAILEMQVIICELVAKFSFKEPDNESSQPRFLNSLQPIVSSGARALPLCITQLE